MAKSEYTYDPATLALKTETISYDLDGQPGFEFSRVIDRSRDTLGRDTGWQLENGTTVENQAAYAYGSDGRLSQVSNPQISNTPFTYSYLPNSNLISTVTGPVHTVTNTWAADRDVLLSKENKIGATVVSSYTYTVNALGQRTNLATAGMAFASSRTTAWGYDILGQLTSALLKDTATGDLIRNSYYAFDRAGNRVSEAVDGGVAKDTPNAINALIRREGGKGAMPIRGQLSKPSQVTINGVAAKVNPDNSFEGGVEVQAGSNAVTVHAVDANGNATTRNYQVVASGGGVKTLTYDLNGNLLDDGSRTFEWDPLNRLAAINYTGTTLRSEFGYNGIGQRIRIVEKDGTTVLSDKRFLWCPGDPQPSQERDASNNVTKRFFGQGVQIGSANYYYTRDHLGSVREMCDSTGAVRARYAYDPWGRRTKIAGDLDADFGFTGHFYHSQSLLSLTLFRAYDPEFGRWLSRDPIGEQGGINLYGYALNNPVNWVDFNGLEVSGSYDISSGKLILTDNSSGEKYVSYGTSGTGNVKDASKSDQGPVPPGSYDIYIRPDGYPKGTGLPAYILDPEDGQKGNDTADTPGKPGNGRFGFRIHIEVPGAVRKGSDGCIVLCAKDLERLRQFLGKTAKGPKQKITSPNPPTPQNPNGSPPDNFGQQQRLGIIKVK
jgi:RHS repeat-associated protein